MLQSLKEDGTQINVFYHYKLIMRPEKRLDESGMVGPEAFRNGYALVAELEACQHVTSPDDFRVKNISIADINDHKSKRKRIFTEDNNNLVCEELSRTPSPSLSPRPPPTPSPTPSDKGSSAAQPRYSNTHLSVADAIQMMRNNTKHLGVLYASTSFVRLRLQGRPIDLPNEKRFTGTHGLAAATEKALRQVERLHDEINFLHQYALKSEERDTIIPGDVIVEKREIRSSKIPTILIVSVLVVVVVNNCFFKFPTLTFEF